MTRLYLMGGFGNNLFQLFLKHILKELNPTIKICTSTTLIKQNRITNFLGWKIHNSFENLLFEESEICHFQNRTILIDFIAFAISKIFQRPIFGRYFDPNLDIDEKQLLNCFAFSGYYQNKSFIERHLSVFNSLAIELSQKFSEPSLALETGVMHIRLGDSKDGWQSIAYYRKVIKMMSEEGIKKIKIITDDPKNLEKISVQGNNIDLIIVNSENDIDDFKILASAQTLAIAPSTFSWWASQINLNLKTLYVQNSFLSRYDNYNKNVQRIIKI